MSERRRARGVSPVAAGGPRDPNHSWVETFEHPVYGNVTLRYQGDDLRRLKWTATDQGQNVHSRHSNSQKFAEILQKLGVER